VPCNRSFANNFFYALDFAIGNESIEFFQLRYLHANCRAFCAAIFEDCTYENDDEIATWQGNQIIREHFKWIQTEYNFLSGGAKNNLHFFCSNFFLQYFLHLTLVEYEFLKYKPSMIGAAAVCLALRMSGYEWVIILPLCSP
jgi:hypothetical protein